MPAQLQRLTARLLEKNGIAKLTMADVRDHCGWERLGNRVVGHIANTLDEAGIGFLPPCDELPIDRNARVWLYVKATDVGRVIEAVLHPNTRGAVPLLRSRASGDAARKLRQIEAIVAGEG